MIRGTGAQAVTAGDGFALAVLATVRPHVARVARRMPGMDGLEFAGRARANPEHRTLPLIAVTALGANADDVKTREAGVDAHLVKPVDFDPAGIV